MKNIKFVSEKKTKFLNIKEYRGYGQIIKISYDGFEHNMLIEPEDPVYGIKIEILKNDILINLPSSITINKLPVLENNIIAAKEFCKEFNKRKDEFFNVV